MTTAPDACTDPSVGELLGSFELGLLDDEQRLSFETHAWECDACFQDLAALSPVTERIREARIAPDGPMAVAAGPAATAPARRWRRWTPLAAAAVAATLALVFFAGPDGRDPGTFRGHATEPIEVTAPRGEVAVPTELDWVGVPSATSYEVRLYSRELAVIWRQRVPAPPAELPAAARDALAASGTFYWEVEAQTAAGSWKSKLTRFDIAR